jgi:hypothetical protein
MPGVVLEITSEGSILDKVVKEARQVCITLYLSYCFNVTICIIHFCDP